MKRYIILLLSLFIVFSISAKELRIARDRTLLKDGPGNYYDTLTVLRINAIVKYLGESKEEPGWLNVAYGRSKGYISKMALKEQKRSTSDMFADLDMSDIKLDVKMEIAPASYTAAIKGFALDYSKKMGYKSNIDKLMKITEFKPVDFFKVRRETKLAYFPEDGELIGLKEGFINQRMKAIGLSASLNVLDYGVVMDAAMTRRMNIIANILNRQTWDYDVQYRVWVIKDAEPVAFSGPGGYIFISSKLIELLTDYRELVAIIAHEVGHIALRHGIHDLALEQARYSAEIAFDELEAGFDDDTLKLSDELEAVVTQAVNACLLVRDDREEYEADDVSVELLRRYKLKNKYLISALNKVNLALGDKYPRYKTQIARRINRLKKIK